MFRIKLFLYELELDYFEIISLCFFLKISIGYWKRYLSSGIYTLSNEKQHSINSIMAMEGNMKKLSSKTTEQIQKIITSKSSYGKTFEYDAIF